MVLTTHKSDHCVWYSDRSVTIFSFGSFQAVEEKDFSKFSELTMQDSNQVRIIVFQNFQFEVQFSSLHWSFSLSFFHFHTMEYNSGLKAFYF